MDDIDRRLLNALQKEFPLVSRPWARLGEKLGLPEADVLARVRRLKEDRLVRQISAIFDSGLLGYAGCLVAMKVAAEREEEAAAILGAHPGVSHSYRREHDFNLWFTLTLPPGMDLGEEIARLSEACRAESALPLPTVRRFKIGVSMDLTGESSRTEREDLSARERPSPTKVSLSDADIRMIRELQKDIAIIPAPFEKMASDLGTTEETVLEAATRFLATGQMRRFAAVLRHREAGFSHNAMTVWVCPEERIEEAGRTMASFKAVTHCYQRPTYPGWPYALFTMIHGQSEAECLEVVVAIEEATGLTDHAQLYSTKEYKKVRVQYFTEDYARYRKAEAASAPVSA